MRNFSVTVLGSSSATPTANRNPSAQIVNINEHCYLIDCGEATQIQIRKYGVRLQKMDTIFISHLHGDHFYGLPGLLGTLHLLGRTNELTIYAPKGLKDIIDVIHKYSDTCLRYQLKIIEIDTTQNKVIYENKHLAVKTIPLNHRVACCGFLFTEMPHQRNLKKEKLAEYKIPVEYINAIKAGDDYTLPDGKVIPNTELILPAAEIRSYAYCSDTCYHEPIIEQIKNCNLLYHESTFANDKADRATETYHSTAAQAATIALKANVKKLMLGHFSARYNDVSVLLNEALPIFEHSHIAEEGITYDVI
jgi:ribonuclease Z